MSDSGPFEMLLYFAFFWLAVPGGMLYLLLRFVRAYERRSAARVETAALETRVLQLEENLSVLSEQLDQLAEGHRFTTRVLSERQPASDAT